MHCSSPLSAGAAFEISQGKQADEFSSLSIILQHDMNYFKRRGLTNTVVAFAMLFFWFFILPDVMKPFWKWYSDCFENKQVMHFLTTILVADGSYLLINSIFVFLYWLKHPVVDKFKVLEDPWPWEKDPVAWKKTMKSTIWNFVLNHLFFLPCSLIFFNLTYGFIHKHSIDQYPSTLEMLLNFVVLTISEDTMFYWSHRLLHYGWFYKHIHKQHHEYFSSCHFC